MSEDFETKLIGGGHEQYEGDALFIPEKYEVQVKLIHSLKREISFKADRKAYKELKELIKAYQPDIVHTHASKAGALGRLAASNQKVPVIIHTYHGHVFHNYFGKVKTGIYKLIERYLARKSSCLIAISPIQKKELSHIHKIAPASKFEVVPLGFDLNKFNVDFNERRKAFRDQYNTPEDAINIGLIGRLTAIKNHDLFLNSLQVVAENSTKQINAFIVGDGELRNELETKAKQILGSHKHINVIFTSWIQKIELILPGMDIVCLTSLNEGTPVSLIEAQAASVPVVSTNVGGVKDIVMENKTGVIVDSFDPKIYGQTLLELIENSELRHEMALHGWEFVKEKFHYSRLANDMEKLYKSLLNEKKK